VVLPGAEIESQVSLVACLPFSRSRKDAGPLRLAEKTVDADLL